MPDDTSAPAEVAAPGASAPAAEAPSLSMSDALSAFNEAGLSPTSGLSGPAAPAEGAVGRTNESEDADLPAPPVDNGAPSPGAQRPGAQKPGAQAQNSQFLDAGARAEKLKAIDDPAERERLAKMSNPSFNRFFDIALKLQNGDLVPKDTIAQALAAREAELKAQFDQERNTTLSSRFFDHERGYTLTPEYEQAAAAVQAHDDHAQFWQEQLGKIRSGQPYQLLTQTKEGWRIGNQLFDPKDPSAEGHVLAKLTENITARQTWQQKLAEIPTGHKKTYGEFTGRVTQLDKELFEKATAPQFTQAVAKTLEQWPAGLRGRPEIALIAKMQVAGQLLLNRIQALEAQAQAKGNSVAALKNAAPAPVDTGGITPPDNTAAAVAELNRLTQSRW